MFDMFSAELLKLRRSQAWAVVIGLPLVIVGAASFNTLLSGKPLEHGWDTLWLRSVGLHGLMTLAVGVGVLASLVWRAEHRHGNWNALMTSSASSLRLVLAKTLVVGVLAAAMQLVLVLTVTLVGLVGYELPGTIPPRYLAVSVLVAAACLPLAAFQSLLSMLLRSFAVPVALALVGAGVAAVLLVAKVQAAMFVLPHALANRTAQLTTGGIGDDGSPLGPGIVLSVLAASGVLTALVVAASTAVLERRDVHA